MLRPTEAYSPRAEPQNKCRHRNRIEGRARKIRVRYNHFAVRRSGLHLCRDELARVPPLGRRANNPILTSGTIPLILPPEGSLLRNRVIKALRDRNMDAQIVMQTPTTLGIQTAVEAGLGISAMNRNSIPPFLRVIPSPDPMPLLPNIFFALFSRKGTLDPATSTVIRSIRHCLDTSMSY